MMNSLVTSLSNKPLATKQVDIPFGYKQTELGVIPEDWEVNTLQAICKAPITYGIVQCGPHVENGVPYIRVSDMNSKELDLREMLRTSPSIAASFSRSKVEEGDIVYALRGKLGHVRMILRPLAGANLTQGTARISPLENISNGYLFWALQSPKSLEQAAQEAKGSTFVEITLANLKRIKVAIPKRFKEQEAIANVLSDTDALITELEQLIAKKKAIKSATMQQLLTGRTRLPQFAKHPDGTLKDYKSSELGLIPEDWKATTIKELTKKIIDYRGRTPKKLGMDWGGGNILALSAGNVKKGFIDFQSENYVGSYELYKKWMVAGDVQKDDIVFTMEAPLGNAALIPNDEKYILSQRTILLQVNREKYNPQLVIQIFLTNHFQEYIANSATGSTAQGIKRSVFEKLSVVLPACLQEQTAIATILSDMDAELSVLEQKLAKVRDIKQGMMQQLLTGRIRLPLDHQP